MVDTATAPIEDIYSHIHETSERVDPALIERLYSKSKIISLLTAIGWRNPRESTLQFRQLIQDLGICNIHIDVTDTDEPPHYIFSNHQGPSDSRPQESDTPLGMGIMDTVLSETIDPPGTRTVMKDGLTRIDFRSMSKTVRACMTRRVNPIVLHRPTTHNRKEAMAQLRAERARVWEVSNAEVCKRTPVKIYAEGTRSPTGKVLPVMPDLCESLVDQYLNPRLTNQIPLCLDMQIIDTHQAFPYGLGKDVPAFNRPITIQRHSYMPNTDLLSDIHAWEGDKEELPRLGKRLAIDMQSAIEQRLRDVIIGTL